MKRILLTVSIWIGSVTMQELMPVLAPEQVTKPVPQDGLMEAD
jgi:hypothetical protein